MAHLSQNEVDRYLRKEITADEVRLIESHLPTCERCRLRVSDPRSIDTAYELMKRSLDSESIEAHIDYEELASYVDGHVDAVAREVIESHVKICSYCETSLDELVRLRDVIRSDNTRATPPVPFWRKNRLRIGLEALAVGLIILAAGAISIRQIQRLRGENDELRRSISESEATIADLKNHIDSLESTRPHEPNGAGPAITLQISDGASLVAIDSEGRLHGLESLRSDYRESIKEALETGKVKTSPVIAQLRGNPETIMKGAGSAPAFNLLSPVGKVVEAARPMFRWSKLDDAIAYEVSISVVGGGLVQKTKVSGTAWRPPVPLQGGQIYQWQVRAITGDSREIKAPSVEQPDAKFTVLDPEMRNEIEQARSIQPTSHLLMGILYAKAGLIDEARHEFRSLHEANRSPVTRRILDGLIRISHKSKAETR